MHEQAWKESFASEYRYPSDAISKWVHLLGDGRNIVLLALHKERGVAFLRCCLAAKVPEITDLYVLRQFRRSGIARLLLNRITDIVVGKITLWVSESNVAAISLYSSFGFVRIGASRPELRHKDSLTLVEMSLP